ncbi:helix-turn-helix domain-containing protein [Rhodococcus erythropolis]|nr:helix-turn-helix domain-containing protein [Rhodococcus erythropolis]
MAMTELPDPGGQYVPCPELEQLAIPAAQVVCVREIARSLGRDPSTISRELRRNAATRDAKLEYRVSVAQWKAELLAWRSSETGDAISWPPCKTGSNTGCLDMLGRSR